MTDNSNFGNYYNLLNRTLRLLGILYLILGTLKLHGILFPSPLMREYLQLSNPIVFFLHNSVVLGTAAICEILIGMWSLQSKRQLSDRALLLLWLACSTMVYKLALVLVHYKGPCGCLFGIHRFLPMSTSSQRWTADLIMASTVLVSCSGLICARWARRDRNIGGTAASTVA